MSHFHRFGKHKIRCDNCNRKGSIRHDRESALRAALSEGFHDNGHGYHECPMCFQQTIVGRGMAEGAKRLLAKQRLMARQRGPVLPPGAADHTNPAVDAGLVPEVGGGVQISPTGVPEARAVRRSGIHDGI